jgi:hypothetical protein
MFIIKFIFLHLVVADISYQINNTTVSPKLNYNNYCGNLNIIDCTKPCPYGLDSECNIDGYRCLYLPDNCNIKKTMPGIINEPINNYCGLTFDTVNCLKPCQSGLNSDCDKNEICYSALELCNSKFNSSINNNISIFAYIIFIITFIYMNKS